MPVRAFNTRLLLDQFDFSGDTKGVTVALSKAQIDASVLQTAGAILVPDKSMGVIEINGYFRAIVGAGAFEQELAARIDSGADAIVSVCLDTTAVGNAAYVQPTTWQNQMTIDGSDKLIMLKGTFEDTTERGEVACHDTLSATGDQSIIDMGAQGSLGGWAVLHVRAIVGTATNATFVVKSSSASTTFTTPTTHGTFTISAVGASRLAIAVGAVKRYMRLECTSLGGATSIAVTAIFGSYGVTG
jgi:hypothetical protein